MEFSINRRETVPNVITSLISSHVITPFTDILFLRCLCLGIINNRNWHKNYLRMLTLSVIKPNRISGYKLKLKKKQQQIYLNGTFKLHGCQIMRIITKPHNTTPPFRPKCCTVFITSNFRYF